MLKELIDNVLNSYLSNPKDVDRTVTHLAPTTLTHLACIPAEYKVYGRTGAGNRAPVPWFGVFDKAITTSAKHGYYIVYLFNSKMNGVYLSLNQGWTDYDKKFKGKLGRLNIEKTARYCRHLIHTSLDKFPEQIITLDASTNLSRGYELGHICGKFYSATNLPEDLELISDLRDLMGVYAELKGLLSEYESRPITELLEIVHNKESERENADEIVYQKEIGLTEPAKVAPAPQARSELIEGSTNLWKKNPGIAKSVLIEKNYSCELHSEHKTFISKTTGKNFVEAHHLVPMMLQGNFTYSLDVPANIVVLCPNCHKMLHLARSNEKLDHIKSLYSQRQATLKEYGIHISVEELIETYEQ